MVIGNNRKPTWVFYPGWAVLSALSIPIAFVVTLAIIVRAIVAVVGGTIQVGGQTHITEDFLGLYFLLPSIGLLSGFLQYLLLRRYLPHMGWWIGATFLGWLLTLVPLRVLYTAFSPALNANSQWSVPLAGVALGVAIGLPQWWLLRRHINRASWWILASAVGWGAALLFTDGAISSSQEVLSVVLLPPVAGSIAWWWLLRKMPQQSPNGGNTPRNTPLETLTPPGAD
jgi:hypothetical protein